jgi:predicted anti-sigma-YlaC factor YlaD
MVADRLDEHDRAASDAHAIGADLREAYERGRRDERASRRRHPIGMTVTFALAAIGLVLLVLAGVNGSFTTAGTVVDQNLQLAVNRAGPAVSQAADNAQAKVADATR